MMRKLVRNIFIRNWGLKLFSLILAIFLWLTLIPEEKMFQEKSFTVSLEPYNIPAEVELVEKPPDKIDVTIRASKSRIDQITSANVVAKLDLKNASVIQEEYPLNETMISLPPGAEVTKVSPNKVNLRLENTREVRLDVEPNIIGELGEGLKLEKIEVTPPKVNVKGAESKIKDKDKVRTSPIDISSLTESAEIEADLILPNPDLRLTNSQSKVRVNIIIQKEETKEEKRGKK